MTLNEHLDYTANTVDAQFNCHCLLSFL